MEDAYCGLVEIVGETPQEEKRYRSAHAIPYAWCLSGGIKCL